MLFAFQTASVGRGGAGGVEEGKQQHDGTAMFPQASRISSLQSSLLPPHPHVCVLHISEKHARPKR